MDIVTITHFFGWCLAVNLVIFTIAFIMTTGFKGLAMGLHKKLFNVDEDFLTQNYFNYLARYKLLIIFFNLVPYLVLRLAIGV